MLEVICWRRLRVGISDSGSRFKPQSVYIPFRETDSYREPNTDWEPDPNREPDTDREPDPIFSLKFIFVNYRESDTDREPYTDRNPIVYSL